jgi:hypothetical protein
MLVSCQTEMRLPFPFVLGALRPIPSVHDSKYVDDVPAIATVSTQSDTADRLSESSSSPDTKLTPIQRFGTDMIFEPRLLGLIASYFEPGMPQGQ